MLAVAATTLPQGPPGQWYAEVKWDGVRALCYLDGHGLRLLSRNDRDVTAAYPELGGLTAALRGRPALLDGEVVAFDETGRPSFAALQPRMHVGDAARAGRLAADTPVRYLAFDVLHLDGQPLLDAAYADRRARLDALDLDGPHWQTPPAYPDGPAVLAASREQGLEGVVVKRAGSRYQPGRRSPDWVKVKNLRTQEVVVGGWKPGAGRRAGTVGSLLLGVPDESGALRYVGHVGTGFDDRTLADLHARLSALGGDAPPYADQVPAEHARAARWVRPRLVGEVSFTEWTRDGRLRHPVWRGLRADKRPAEVRREP